MARALEISLFCFVGGLLPAQEREAATKPAGKASAAASFQELARLQSERVKGVVPSMARNDPNFAANQKRLEEAPRLRVQDLQAFLEQFPRGPESTRARLEIVQIAVRDERFAADGKKVLEALETPEVDLPSLLQFMTAAGKLEVKTEGWLPLVSERVAKADALTTFQAAAMARQVGLEDKRDEWVKQAVAKATTTEDRLLAARMLRLALGDEPGAQKLLADAEKAARTPEDRARILMEKVASARAGNRGEEAKTILEEIVKLYPSSATGQIAKGQLEITAITVGSEPIPFLARDLSGKEVSLADYKGKVLLIEFWATWCGPCMGELPNVIAAYDQHHAEGFEILGISLDREGDREKLEACLAERKIEWRQVFDGGFWRADVAQLYGVKGIPFTVLVGRDGKVAATNVRGAQLEVAVKRALEAR